VAAGPAPAKIRALRLRAEHIRNGLEQGPEFRVSVTGSLDRLGVDPERDVVDEHPPVHLTQIDPTLAAVDESVEPADDVVSVDPEVEGEVVAGAGWDAGVRQTVLGGDRGDDCLRAIASGHRQRIGSVRHRSPHQLLEIVTAPQLHRLDASASRLLGQVEALRFPATRLRIEEQHRMPGRGGAREDRADGERSTGGGDGGGREGHDRCNDENVGLDRHQDDGGDQRQRREREGNRASGAAPRHPVRKGDHGQGDTCRDREPLGEACEGYDDREYRRRGGEAQRSDRR